MFTWVQLCLEYASTIMSVQKSTSQEIRTAERKKLMLLPYMITRNTGSIHQFLQRLATRYATITAYSLVQFQFRDKQSLFYEHHNGLRLAPDTESTITITILDIIVFKTQLNSIGLSVPHRNHITSPLRAQQVNAICRFVTMVY
jgi:hypothetical protein